jgi:hypothetical protein
MSSTELSQSLKAARMANPARLRMGGGDRGLTKDLGAGTASAAAKISAFDPGAGWQEVVTP